VSRIRASVSSSGISVARASAAHGREYIGRESFESDAVERRAHR
jgi:hypothetical protein